MVHTTQDGEMFFVFFCGTRISRLETAGLGNRKKGKEVIPLSPEAEGAHGEAS